VYAVHTFQALEGADAEAKCSIEAFMTPIVDGAYAPVRSLANDTWSIDARVIKVQSDAELDAEFSGYAKEFVKRFLGGSAHSLVPVDPDQVLERQSRPTQVHILKDADSMGCNAKKEDVVIAFQKNEVVAMPAPPRNISTVAASCKLQYSRVVYAMSELLKTVRWYAFSQSPVACANRVVEVCRDASTVSQSDFSKMDGTIAQAIRSVENYLITHAFSPEYACDALKWAETQRNRKCFTSFGVQYNSKTSRLSGSPETSFFNTITNALAAYTTFRVMGYAPDAAYDALGVYGGDDGITANIDPDLYKEVCLRWGLTAKCNVAHPGEPITFLARVYGPDVWHGSPNSCCDILRQLRKFHTTVKHPDTPIVKFTEKLRSYYLTDSNTPPFRQLIATARRFLDLTVAPKATYCSYTAITYPAEVQYPNDLTDWYEHYARSVLPDFAWDTFYAWLDGVSSAEALLIPPCCLQPPLELSKADRSVVVDGSILRVGEVSGVSRAPAPVGHSPAGTSAAHSARAKRSNERARRHQAARLSK
jgi:hypothetical protein